jgi:hypothetical protein
MEMETGSKGTIRLIFSKKHLILLSMFLLLNACVCRPAHAGYSRGGSFTAPGYGARAWSMGGAAIASTGGEEAIFWNPAMLAYLEQSRIGASYINLVPGAKAYHSHLAYARIIKRTRDDDIDRSLAQHAIGFIYGNLRMDMVDGSGYNENTFRFAYSYTPEYFISFGAAFNFLVSTSDADNFGGTGSSVDAGIRLGISSNMTFAFVARNAASQLSYEDGEDLSLTRSYTCALASGAVPYIDVEADVVFAHGGVSRYILGAEGMFFSDALALRGGISSLQSGESRLIPHLGLGFKFNRFQINYNANLDSNKAFEDTHRFSLSAAL